MLEALDVSIVLFVSTNTDDLFVLVAFFADPRVSTRSIVIGQYVGIATLVGASVLLALVSLALPRDQIGLLGLLPVLIGGKKLLEMFGSSDQEAVPV